MNNGLPWSSAEVEMLLRLKAEGYTDAAIAVELGRSTKGVVGKLEYIGLNPLQREERRQALRRRRIAEGIQSKRLHPNGQIIASSRPDQERVAERNARYAAPHRDLTAAFFGDPPVGFSALERRA